MVMTRLMFYWVMADTRSINQGVLWISLGYKFSFQISTFLCQRIKVTKVTWCIIYWPLFFNNILRRWETVSIKEKGAIVQQRNQCEGFLQSSLCHLATHLREGPALTLQAALGREGHAGPRGGAVEHDPAVGFTNSTTGEGGQGVSQKSPVQTSTVKKDLTQGIKSIDCTAHLLYWRHKDMHKKEES